MLEAEIRAYYKDLHDSLSADYYAGTSGLSKEEFDLQHGQIWADMRAALIAGGYLTEPEPPRDYGKEIDTIDERLKVVEKR